MKPSSAVHLLVRGLLLSLLCLVIGGLLLLVDGLIDLFRTVRPVPREKKPGGPRPPGRYRS